MSIINCTFVTVQITNKNSSYPIGYPMVNQNLGSLENTDKNQRVREPLSPPVKN